MIKDEATQNFQKAVSAIDAVSIRASATEWKGALMWRLKELDKDDRERLMQIVSARAIIPVETIQRWYFEYEQAEAATGHKQSTASMQKAFDNWWIGYSQSEPTEADKDSRKYLLMFTAFRAGWVSGRSMTG